MTDLNGEIVRGRLEGSLEILYKNANKTEVTNGKT